MAINAGRMKKRISFLRMRQERDEIGDHPTPEVFIKRWAEVKVMRGGEYYEAQKLRPELTYRITCRWFAGLTPDMLIDYDGRKLAIADAIDVDEQHKWWEIHATEYIRKAVTTDGPIDTMGAQRP